MNIESFLNKVKLMRKYQRAWFKDHKQSDLQLAKKLEKDVDQALEEGITYPTATLEEREGNGQQLPLIEEIPTERLSQFDEEDDNETLSIE